MIRTRTYSPLTLLVVFAVLTLCVSGSMVAQGTLSDSLVLRNAGNGRTTLLTNPATVPAGSWTLVYPPTAGATGAMMYGTLAGSTTTLSWIPVGSDGQVLTLSGGLPTWSTAPGWLTTGNNITASWDGVTGSFLGTTNAEDLVMNTNNVFRARLVGGAVNTGNLVIGTTAAAPTNSTAATALDRVTILGGDLSLNSENNAAITRSILFRGTSGNGNFRIGADGGDIFWQGGGSMRLQEGSYWGIEIRGNRQVGAFPAFVAGTVSDPHVNIIGAQNALPILVTTPTLTFTSNQQEWRNSTGTALSVVNATGNFGIGVTSGISSKLEINASSTSGNAIQLDPWNTAATNTGQIRFLELAANGSNYAALRAGDNMAATNIYTLPTAVGTAGQVLSINTVTGTNATLSWASAGSSILEEVTAGAGDIRRKVAYTNGTVGAPGIYATDLMGSRSAASMTASGNYAGILAGANNTASANYTFVGAGSNNTASSSYAGIAAGSFNTASGQYSFVGSGSTNVASGTYSAIPGGSGNTVSGNYSMAFGYGANVTQANSIVFNHTTVGDGSTRVGIDIDAPATSLDIDGGLTIRPSTTNTAVTGNNQTVTPGNRSYIVLDPGGGNRTGLILANGLQAGQVLILRILETAANYIQMPDAAANNVNLTGNWVGRADDTITLIWSGTDWVETSRSNN